MDDHQRHRTKNLQGEEEREGGGRRYLAIGDATSVQAGEAALPVVGEDVAGASLAGRVAEVCVRVVEIHFRPLKRRGWRAAEHKQQQRRGGDATQQRTSLTHVSRRFSKSLDWSCV